MNVIRSVTKVILSFEVLNSLGNGILLIIQSCTEIVKNFARWVKAYTTLSRAVPSTYWQTQYLHVVRKLTQLGAFTLTYIFMV